MAKQTAAFTEGFNDAQATGFHMNMNKPGTKKHAEYEAGFDAGCAAKK